MTTFFQFIRPNLIVIELEAMKVDLSFDFIQCSMHWKQGTVTEKSGNFTFIFLFLGSPDVSVSR